MFRANHPSCSLLEFRPYVARCLRQINSTVCYNQDAAVPKTKIPKEFGFTSSFISSYKRTVWTATFGRWWSLEKNTPLKHLQPKNLSGLHNFPSSFTCEMLCNHPNFLSGHTIIKCQNTSFAGIFFIYWGLSLPAGRYQPRQKFWIPSKISKSWLMMLSEERIWMQEPKTCHKQSKRLQYRET